MATEELIRLLTQLIAFLATILLLLTCGITYLLFKFRENRNEIKKLKIDGPTGVLRREVWEEKLALRLKKKSQAVCIIDLDYLKKFNDQYGHQFGDVVIKILANAAEYNLKEKDLIGRYGGDEFVIAFDATDVINGNDRVFEIMERVRERFASDAQTYFEKKVGKIETPFQFSFGHTIAERGRRSLETIYSEADQKLYEQKAARNKQLSSR